MQPDATIERILDLSACYFGLRKCGIDDTDHATQEVMQATPEQAGSVDPALRCRH